MIWKTGSCIKNEDYDYSHRLLWQYVVEFNLILSSKKYVVFSLYFNFVNVAEFEKIFY